MFIEGTGDVGGQDGLSIVFIFSSARERGAAHMKYVDKLITH